MGEEEDTKIGRRALLEWAAASAALAGCARAPVRKIVPYVTQPPEIRPGRPLHYATAWEIDGYAMGLVALSRDGRPTKVEGNPKHPASLGATRAIDQALIEMLWDPDRTNQVRTAGTPTSIEDLENRVAHKRVAFLMEPTASRTVLGLVLRVRRELPGSSVWFHSPLARAGVWAAGRAATGRLVEPVLDASKARALVAFASDFLASGHACVRDARGVADKRAADGLRLYAVESRRTPTGAFADERLATTPRARAQIACAIAGDILSDPKARASDALRALAGRLRGRAGDARQKFAAACARDLVASPGGAWIVGDAEPLEMHALGWLVNQALGAVGTVVRPVPSSVVDAGGASFDEHGFENALESGVDVAVVCGVNPLYTNPHGRLAALLAKTPETVYVGLLENETSRACRWFVPLAHPLESWGDVRADDGTGSIVQPLIEPVFGGLTVAEVLARLLGDVAPNAHDLVRKALALSDDDWNRALADGVIDGTATTELAAFAGEDALARAVDGWRLPPERPMEVDLHPSHALHDGRFVSPLLLELPEPISTLTWGNAAVISRATARSLDVVDGDFVRVARGDRSIDLPVLEDAGQADGVVSIALGWGQDGAERLARDVGANAFVLREAPDDAKVSLEKTGRSERLPRTQINHGLEGREHEIARSRGRTDAAIPSDTKMRPSLYVPQLSPTAPHAWAMTIDLSRCTGCASCVAACQVENNVPTVGKQGVIDMRHMHWIRIDTYESKHGLLFQPMLCQHCDDAPCEYVCPVNATVHSPDGLNEMVYNRCVGTRFCSNNCPYKVRRFNWFNYHEQEDAVRQLEHNPQVTVRARGVMEKCSFCVQRIREAEHVAHALHRDLRRDEVVTACQQACPTRAIVFGDKRDAGSAVSRGYGQPEAYAVLDELGTRPRVHYFPKIVDENPELK